MHKWAKEIMDCVKAKVVSIGVGNMDVQEVEELKYWTEIAKNITCFDKDYKICEGMEKNETYELDKQTYKENTPQVMRDMDRTKNIMYYTEPETAMSEYDKYSKKFADMHDRDSFEHWLNAFTDDMLANAQALTPELKTIAKTKLNSNLIARL